VSLAVAGVLDVSAQGISSITGGGYNGLRFLELLPSRRVVTSTWWEGLVLPMIPRAMPAGA
jgi:hypothetical protein